jgi:hypothetical protein
MRLQCSSRSESGTTDVRVHRGTADISIYALIQHFSVRFCCRAAGRHPGHWTRVYSLEQDRCGHVGTRYVSFSFLICADRDVEDLRRCADADYLDLEKRQHYIAERKQLGHRESGKVGERLKET